MNQASLATRHLLAAIGGAAATLFAPCRCWAADQPVPPWDNTLNVMQNFVAGPFAQSVIIISGFAAVLTFALAGDNDLVRRLAKAVIGTGVALIVVQFLNYLAP